MEPNQPTVSISSSADGTHRPHKRIYISITVFIVALLVGVGIYRYQYVTRTRTSAVVTPMVSQSPDRAPLLVEAISNSGTTAHLSVPADITTPISAIAWVPNQTEFIGGMFEFSPLSLKFPHQTMLSIKIPDSVQSTFAFADISIYVFNSDTNTWDRLASEIIEAERIVRATVSHTGTYTIGHDEIPPTVRISDPQHGEQIEEGWSPFITGSAIDSGVGIRAERFEMAIDGIRVEATYLKTGEFQYLPAALPTGKHTVTVTAVDAAENIATASAHFTIQ